MKTEVYSWRLDPDLRAELETIARRKNKSFGALLDEYARNGARKDRERVKDDEAEQARIRARVEKVIGSVAFGGGPYTNDKIRDAVVENLTRKHARNRPH